MCQGMRVGHIRQTLGAEATEGGITKEGATREEAIREGAGEEGAMAVAGAQEKMTGEALFVCDST